MVYCMTTSMSLLLTMVGIHSWLLLILLLQTLNYLGFSPHKKVLPQSVGLFLRPTIPPLGFRPLFCKAIVSPSPFFVPPSKNFSPIFASC